jgi:hypothetical protein
LDLSRLFVEELGWDRHAGSLEVLVDGRPFSLDPVAHKRGLAVYCCPGQIPDYLTRRRIERQVAKSIHEHLIIYTDEGKSTQIWQWVKREAGKPTACREHTHNRNQSGDPLIQKLQALVFTLDEEERLTIVDVTGRTRAAFDVERVTKRFYDRFKTEHAAFLNFIKGIPDEDLHRWYASVMLNRLMFIYFIQKKGFLNSDSNYLANKLTESKRQGRDRFYRGFLCPLFFEGFAKRETERSPQIQRFLGKVPYLNGGIFLRHQIEESHGQSIQIPDGAFEDLFAFFEQYQWHLDERPLRNDREINPDVLGYIFEKYINQKQMGAYYTKEDITGYISQNTVIPFLFDTARQKCRIAFEGDHSIWRLLQADPDRYIYDAVKKGVIDDKGNIIPESLLPDFVQKGMRDPKARMFDRRYNLAEADLRDSEGNKLTLPTETWREYVQRRQRCLELRGKLAAGEVNDINDFITYNLNIRQFAQDVIENSEGPELLRAFWHAIEKITVLDPTVGSGAFLFAALNILEPLYEACLDRMEVFVAELENSGEKHRPEKFGDFRKILGRIAQHPNRRYFVLKSIIINNLYGVDIMDEAVEICKLRLFLKLVAQVERVENIEPLPDIDFNIRAGNTLVGFATLNDVREAITHTEKTQGKFQFDDTLQSIEEKAQDVDRLSALFRQQQTAIGGEVTPADKQELRTRLKALDGELNRYLGREYGIDPKKKDAYATWLMSHKPFHWFIEFYGIMKSGGFDAIIGNPPYVEYRKVSDVYKLQRDQYRSEKADNLYAFCMERSGTLLLEAGWFGMIVPAGVLGLDETCSLRRVLLDRLLASFCSTYAIRPCKLFDAVDQRLCIYLAKGGRNTNSHILTSRYNHWNAEERSNLFALQRYAPSFLHSRLGRIPQVGSPDAAAVLSKLEATGSRTISSYFSTNRSGNLMHYHRSPRYWIRAMDFDQYFKSPTRTRSIHHFRDLYFQKQDEAEVIGAMLNSSLFFWWFVSVGNGRNITGTDIDEFPLGGLTGDILRQSHHLFNELMADYKMNSFIRVRRDCEFQEFRPSMSKSIIDKIDSCLAQHYDFTSEELDFIINYDIKYRMGRDEEHAEELND